MKFTCVPSKSLIPITVSGIDSSHIRSQLIATGTPVTVWMNIRLPLIRTPNPKWSHDHQFPVFICRVYAPATLAFGVNPLARANILKIPVLNAVCAAALPFCALPKFAARAVKSPSDPGYWARTSFMPVGAGGSCIISTFTIASMIEFALNGEPTPRYVPVKAQLQHAACVRFWFV